MGCSARLHPHDNPLKKYKGLRPPATPGWARSFTRKGHSPQEIDKKDPISFYLLLIGVSGEAVNPNKIQIMLFNYTHQKGPILQRHLGLRPFIIPITPGAQFLSPKDKILS